MAIKPQNLIQGLLGLLTMILAGLFSWTLVEVNALNKEVLTIRTERAVERNELDDAQNNIETKLALMQQTLDSIASDTDTDAKQDSQLKKHWVIVGRHRDWINELRAKAGLPLVSWPDLSGF